jgi:hypothetical protein
VATVSQMALVMAAPRSHPAEAVCASLRACSLKEVRKYGSTAEVCKKVRKYASKDGSKEIRKKVRK